MSHVDRAHAGARRRRDRMVFSCWWHEQKHITAAMVTLKHHADGSMRHGRYYCSSGYHSFSTTDDTFSDDDKGVFTDKATQTTTVTHTSTTPALVAGCTSHKTAVSSVPVLNITGEVISVVPLEQVCAGTVARSFHPRLCRHHQSL